MLSNNKKTYLIISVVYLAFIFLCSEAFGEDWQQKFTDSFVSSKYTSMYLMISSSSYSNVGHIAIYIDGSGEGKYEKVEANASIVGLSKPLSKSSISYIKSFFSSKDALPNFSYKSFGGINFKYIHLEKAKPTSKEYSTVKILNIKNPDSFKDQPNTSEYISLKNFFYDMSFTTK